MKRRDAMEAVYAELDGCVVVTIMGAVAAELQSIGHRPNFFYLQHAMGLASSMGLGIALSRPGAQGRRVRRRRFDPHEPRRTDDARALPAEESRARRVRQRESAVGRRFPDGDVDRERHRRDGRGGGHSAHERPCATSTSSPPRSRSRSPANELTTIVAKVEAVGPSGYVTDLSLLENRYQFQRYLRTLRNAHAQRT